MATRMQIFTRAIEASEHARESRKRRVLVPTMGALHRAHLQLVRTARDAAGPEGEIVVSIFVNPLQFEPGSDFEKYPRPAKVDEELCQEAGVDLLFRPAPAEMYLDDRSIVVEETTLSQTLCGRSRPGHFRGVCTVVAKLFNILRPDAAVFGEKDFQQLAIIRRMVRDLNFPVEIIGVPTVREADGLAASSRNAFLDPRQREQAAVLHQALAGAAAQARQGEMSAQRLTDSVRAEIGNADLARIDYVEIVNANDLQPAAVVDENSLMAVAVFFGKTRLIDNIRLR